MFFFFKFVDDLLTLQITYIILIIYFSPAPVVHCELLLKVYHHGPIERLGQRVYLILTAQSVGPVQMLSKIKASHFLRQGGYFQHVKS